MERERERERRDLISPFPKSVAEVHEKVMSRTKDERSPAASRVVAVVVAVVVVVGGGGGVSTATSVSVGGSTCPSVMSAMFI